MVALSIDDTTGVVNAYDIEPCAMSDTDCQDEAITSIGDVRQRNRAVQRIRVSAPKTSSSHFGEKFIKGGDASQGFTSMQTSDRTIITNRVREVFSQRIKNVHITGISYFLTKTEFSGEVRTVDSEGRLFWADVTNVANSEERYSAKFDMDEVPSADVFLVRPGALFYWIVGRENTNGTERNISQICFRRMASIGKKQMRKIEGNARKETEVIRSVIVEA